MNDIWITLIILVVAVAVFVWNKLPVEMVALFVSLALLFCGIISFEEIFEGFASPTIVLIAALFVVAEAIDAAGITTWLGGLLVKFAGTSRPRLVILIMTAVAVLTAIITVNGAVAALLPMVVVLCVRLGQLPSKLLLPLAFAAHAGSLLVLTGSPVNILIFGAAVEAGTEGIGFFEFGLVGLPLLIGTIAIVVFLGDKLLPARQASTLPRDLSEHSRVLMEQYLDDDDLIRLRISEGSPVIGLAATKALAAEGLDVHVLSIQTAAGKPLTKTTLSAGDFLVVRGKQAPIEEFAASFGLEVERGSEGGITCGLISKSFGVAEVIVAPRSALIDTEVYPGMVTGSGQLVILAHQRLGQPVSNGGSTVRSGDSLLLQGSWAALDRHTQDQNVLLVDTPDAIRRQTVPLGPKAVPALIILGAMVAMLTTDVVPAAIACLLAAIAMVLLRVITPSQAHRSMQWQTLILVAAMIPLSTAITRTGTAELLANGIVQGLGSGSPYLLLIGIFGITALLGQLISNTATALIIIPIGISVAAEAGISPIAILMCISVASSAALMTPVATPANMMIMQPAGYRFGDYWKLGIVVMALYFVIAVFLVPVFWPF